MSTCGSAIPRIRTAAGPEGSWSIPAPSTRSFRGSTSKGSDSNRGAAAGYVLADGKPATLDITIAEIEFEGEVVGGTIVYGEEGSEPLLGVTALGSAGFEVDPRNEVLKRLPAVLLKALR